MTSKTIQQDIEQTVPILLGLAREATWNDISNNCEFILTEIKDTQDNFHLQRLLRKQENERKNPVALHKLIPTIQNLFDNLYDINLYIHRASRRLTIVDIRYYPKSSLTQDYKQKVLQNPPMLHCKVAQPPWVTDKEQKFDINWEHKQWLINWKLFWTRQRRSSLGTSYITI